MMQRLLLLLLALMPFVAQAQKIAITFDDLPAHGDLPPGVTRLQVAQSVLHTLKLLQMPPVYGFVNGVQLQQAPTDAAVLMAWRDAGQPLGNHTWSHPDLSRMTAAEFEADILKNEPLLQKYMAGQDWHWLRYPYLQEGDTPEKAGAVRTWLKANDYKVAEVSMSFGDYLWNPPYARCMARGDLAGVQQLRESYLAAAKSALDTFRTTSQGVYGRDVPAVLLLHIGAFDARMLRELLNVYRWQGFNFVSLPEALRDPAYAHGTDSDPAAHPFPMATAPTPDALLNNICR
jgi:peptidoglycan/xylan/chitin deacetylase (PgdA/CDA1 family)